jgi:hypothetical protein
MVIFAMSRGTSDAHDGAPRDSCFGPILQATAAVRAGCALPPIRVEEGWDKPGEATRSIPANVYSIFYAMSSLPLDWSLYYFLVPWSR